MAEQQKPMTEIDRLRKENEDLRAKIATVGNDAVKATADDVDLPAERRKFLELSAKEKTKIAVEKEYGSLRGQPGVSDWEVSIPEDKEHPTLRIPAHSEIEAIGFYDHICGITMSELPRDAKKVLAGNAA